MFHPKTIPFALFVLISCADIEDCQLNPYRETLLVNWKYDTTIVFDSITISGYGTLGNGGDTLQPGDVIGLPMDLESDEIQYGFWTDSIDFELSLRYNREIQIFELECEPAIRYYNLELVSTNLDSVAILLSELVENVENPINLEIYL